MLHAAFLKYLLLHFWFIFGLKLEIKFSFIILSANIFFRRKIFNFIFANRDNNITKNGRGLYFFLNILFCDNKYKISRRLIPTFLVGDDFRGFLM